MTTPEARARQNIDDSLTACGWLVQDRAVMNFVIVNAVSITESELIANGTVRQW